MKFKIGDRIQVSNQYSWGKGVYGKIAMPTQFMRDIVADDNPWEGWHRLIKGSEGTIEFYYVIFDTPQLDADNDGPYLGAEIQSEMIKPI